MGKNAQKENVALSMAIVAQVMITVLHIAIQIIVDANLQKVLIILMIFLQMMNVVSKMEKNAQKENVALSMDIAVPVMIIVLLIAIQIIAFVELLMIFLQTIHVVS